MKAFVLIFGLALAMNASAATKVPAKKHKAEVEKTSAVQKSEAAPSHHSHETVPGGTFQVEPNFALAFINPTDINNFITDMNDSIQNSGLKNYSMPKISTSAMFGISTIFKAHRNFGLGLGFNRLSSSTEGSGSVPNNSGMSLNTNVAIGASLLTLDTKITIARALEDKLEAYVGPFLGIGFYQGSIETSGTIAQKNGGSTEINASANGFVFGSTAGARYWFLDNMSAGLFSGYRAAKSSTLTVDSQKNANAAVGKDLENGGKKMAVDASSFLLGANFTWAI